MIILLLHVVELPGAELLYGLLGYSNKEPR